MKQTRRKFIRTASGLMVPAGMLGIAGIIRAGSAPSLQVAGTARVGSLNQVGGGSSDVTPETAWWKMNENTGTNVNDDSSGGLYDLTLSNSAMWTTGNSGSAIVGNASSYYASSAATVNLTGTKTITVCFWLYATGWSASTEILLEFSTDYNNAPTGAARWIVYGDNTGMYAGIAELSGYRAEYIATPSTSNWHHIAIIYDNSTTTGDVSIYLNGSSQSTTISQNDKALNGNFDNQTVYALARGGSSLWSDAKLDDVRIYNRALSGSEITSVYSNPQ